MGVYIKGMEMPANCFLCPLSVLNDNRLFCKATQNEVVRAKIDANCPIVPVPQHGDLIDRKELIKKMVNTPIKALDGIDFDQAWFTRVADTAIQFVDEVERQVAIIQADKEKNDLEVVE